jgi:transcriptional regulator with XRE-family HTH domain
MSPATKKHRAAPRRAATISDQLRSVIASRRLTAYAIAQEAGIAPSTLSRFLAGERGLTTQTLDVVCDALGLELKPTRRGLGTRAGNQAED